MRRLDIRKVFIVDDDVSIIKLYKKFLEFKGFNIIDTARDGMEAIDKFKKFEHKPDVILMDYHMPNKDGIEATREILKIDKKVMIFMISGDIEIEESALAAGARKFKLKPFDLQELYQSLINLNPTCKTIC